MNINSKRICLFFCVTAVAALISCEQDEPVAQKTGQLNFSFTTADNANTGGKVKDITTPAAVSYTLKKEDGTTVNGKIELYGFNGAFTSNPLELNTGHYTLEEFMVLNADNQIVYAAPIEGSPLAALVTTPLSLSLNIDPQQTLVITPEVLAVNGLKPEDFGYINFGFEVLNTTDFTINTSIADNDVHGPIDYTLEIIAKDAPLGAEQWRALYSLSGPGTIHLPIGYGHYTFKAIKAGYITHIQHIPAAELPDSRTLNFEFLPEDLEDFFVRNEDNAVTMYIAKDKCKDYTRIDLAEGIKIYGGYIQKAAHYHRPDGPLTGLADAGCQPDEPLYSPCGDYLNLFNNKPYATADNFCDGIDPDSGSVENNDIYLNAIVFYFKPGETDFEEFYFDHWWIGANN